MKVWLLQHERSTNDGDDVKVIGIYASSEEAEVAQRRLASQPGFRDEFSGFSIDPYLLGQDHWVDGFVSIDEALLSSAESKSRASA